MTDVAWHYREEARGRRAGELLEARLVNLTEYREKHPELEVRGHPGSLVETRVPYASKGLVVGEIERDPRGAGEREEFKWQRGSRSRCGDCRTR